MTNPTPAFPLNNNMKKEIELRAKVSDESYSAILEAVSSSTSVKHQRRCFIDYSTFISGIKERELDVRVRVTNGHPELVAKKGLFGASIREEAVVGIDEMSLADCLSFMSIIGYHKGVCGGRDIKRFMLGDIEVALQNVLDFSSPETVLDRFVEVEYQGDGSEENALASLRNLLAEWNVKEFSIDDWDDYVLALNESANGVYEHGATPVETILLLGGGK